MSEPRRGEVSDLHRHLPRHNRVQVVGYAYDGVEAVQMALSLRPQVLLVEESLAGLSGHEVCRLVSRTVPEVACALVSERTDAAALRAAMTSGARAVLSANDDIRQTVNILQQLAALASGASSAESQRLTDLTRMPVTLAVVAGKEGLGATTLCCVLAAGLARERLGETVLVDWHLQMSEAPSVLGLRPKHGLADIAVYGEQMDAEAVNACLLQHDSGLYVLPGMVSPERTWLDRLARGSAAQLLGILRRRFRFLVCDLPTVLGPGELYACRHAQEVLLVGGLSDASAVRSTATLADLLRGHGVSGEQMRLLVSRVGRGNPFSVEELATLSHLPVAAQIPEDPGLPKAAQAGEAAAGGARAGPAMSAAQALVADLLARHAASRPAPTAAASGGAESGAAREGR